MGIVDVRDERLNARHGIVDIRDERTNARHGIVDVRDERFNSAMRSATFATNG